MRHRAYADFRKNYDAFPKRVRERADKTFELLKQNPRHPSLHFKTVGEKWSARVDQGCRARAIETEDGLLWTWIGSHDDYMHEIG